MKKILLFFLVYTYPIFGQQKMDITNEARYELNFKEYKNQEPQLIKNTFILLFNKNESFFKNMTLYVKDSLVDNGKIKFTGGNEDISLYTKYSTELPYMIYKKGSEISFANEIPYAGQVRYTENVDFKWKITKESKTINGIKCIKATTTKWGRNWIAYYSPKHSMPFGPYKFYGLPGLIFEVADDESHYTFTLYRFKNRKSDNVVLHNYPKAKKVTKKKYETIRHNMAVKPFPGTVEGDPNIGKRITKRKIEAEKNYNPIELKD